MTACLVYLARSKPQEPLSEAQRAPPPEFRLYRKPCPKELGDDPHYSAFLKKMRLD